MSAVAVLTTAALAQESSPPVELPQVTIERFLPVKTPSLTVGVVEPEPRDTGVSQPFFLIGCDDTSLRWLAHNHDRLVALHAFGLVVNAPSVDAYRRLEAAAHGLIVRPVPGGALAEHLGLRHYPVLLTADGSFP